MRQVDHAIVGGIVWVALFALVGRIAGAVKEMAVAARFGVSAELDGYLFVLNVVSLPVAIWFSVLSTVLVPTLTGWSRRWSAALRRFGLGLLGLTALIGAAGGVLAAMSISWLVGLDAIGLGASAAQAAREVAPWLGWVVPAGMIAALGSVWLLAESRHANTLLEAVPAVVILAAVIVVVRDVTTLAIATSVGFAVHCLAVYGTLRTVAPAAGGATSQIEPTEPWRQFRSGFAPMVLAQVLMALTAFVDQFFAARLDDGSIAVLGYASRFAALALGLCAVAIGRSMLPILSSMQQRQADVRRVVERWTGLTMAAGAIAAAVGWAVSEPAVALLLERGAFTPHDTHQVARTLELLLLQLPAYCGGLVLVTWASAARRLRLIVAASAIGFAVKVAAAALLVDRWGLAGIAVATTTMYCATLLVMGWGYLRPAMDRR